MRYAIRHVTEYTYPTPATRAVMRLRLFPPMFEGQYVESWSVTINGEQVYPISRTGFGDESALWASAGAVDTLTIEAQGIVERIDTNGVSRDLPGRTPAGIFLRQTPLTQPDKGLISLAENITETPGLPWLHALNEEVSKKVVYTKGSTNQDTTAAEALSAGKGVCQDHAHVFLSVARSRGYAARYVVGYLYDKDSPELETHGWPEAYVMNLGWVGFDPSHNICTTDQYIRLACGLDAHDAAPLRGSITGGIESMPNAWVEIESLSH